MQKNCKYWWRSGALGTRSLMKMRVSGIVLEMKERHHTEKECDSVERRRRDVKYGWMLRKSHSNGEK